ncbi:MAG: DEAD/DEAH box helicase [Candidatus Anstonellales archaeon]
MFTTASLRALLNKEYQDIDQGFLVSKLRDMSYDIISKKMTPEAWQLKIIEHIVNTNDNVIINVPPASGKTFPVMASINNLLISGKAKKILYVVPIQFLAFSVLRDIETDIKYIHELTMKEIKSSDISKDDIVKIVHKYIGVKIGKGDNESSPTGITPSSHTIIDIATYEHAKTLSSTFSYDITVIDEFQEVTPLKDDPEKEAKAKIYSDIIISSKRIIIITGSLNRNTCEKLAKAIKSVKGVNTEVLPKAESNELSKIGNRSKIILVKSDDLTNDNSLFYFIKNRIVSNIKGDLLVLFSKQRIYYLSEKLVKSLPRTLDLSKKVDLNKYATERPVETTNDIKNEIIMSRTNRAMTMIKEFNPFLKECLEHGFGYIIGGVHEKEGILREIDRILDQSSPEKQLVGDLFSKEIINAVIATDAVGLGVNLKVNSIIIPTIKKFDGRKISFLDQSSLIQIINRAGRVEGKVAYVITSPSAYDDIRSILSMNPILDIEEPDISHFERSLVGRSAIREILSVSL